MAQGRWLCKLLPVDLELPCNSPQLKNIGKKNVFPGSRDQRGFDWWTLPYRYVCLFCVLTLVHSGGPSRLAPRKNRVSVQHASATTLRNTVKPHWSISGITLLYATTFLNNKCFCHLIGVFFLKYCYKWIWILVLSCSLFYYSWVTLLISVVPLIIQYCKIRFILWVIIELNLSVSQILNHCSGWNLWEYCHTRAI